MPGKMNQLFFKFYFFPVLYSSFFVVTGGGITERNLQRILEGSGAQECHCSARSSRDSAMKFRYISFYTITVLLNKNAVLLVENTEVESVFLMCRNTCVAMGAALSAPEYGLKVADVGKIRTLNAIAKNTLWIGSEY